jgi:type IV pilus assembly protein PilA
MCIEFAIAIPAYQDYTIRTKVSEGLNIAGAAKLAVAETFDSKGYMPTGGNASFGLPGAASIASQYVNNVLVGTTGSLTITYATLGGNPNADGSTLILVPITAKEGALDWDCTIANAGGTLISKYRPAECR